MAGEGYPAGGGAKISAAGILARLIGASTLAAGALLYGNGTANLQTLTAGAANTVLLSGAAPSWGKVGLTTHVSGILPVANGGTGLASVTAGQILIGNGTSAIISSANLTYAGSILGVTGSVQSSGVMRTGSLGSGSGGNYQSYSDDGINRWASGVLGYPGAKHYEIYDVVNAVTRLLIDRVTGAVIFGADPGGSESARFGGGIRTNAQSRFVGTSSGASSTEAVAAAFFENPSLAGRGVAIGFDSATDVGFIIARHNATGPKRLHLQPTAGEIVFGADPGGSELFRVGGTARISGSVTGGIFYGTTYQATGTIPSVSANAIFVDFGDNARVLATGTNTSTHGILRLITASANASLYTVGILINNGLVSIPSGPLIVYADPGGSELFRVGGAARINGSLTVTSGNVVTSGNIQVLASTAAAYIDRTTGVNPSSIFFRDSSATKFNWIIGAQINVDNAFEITPSTAAGGGTYASPAFRALHTGQIVIGPTDPGGTQILRVAGSVRIADGGFITSNGIELIKYASNRVTIGENSANRGAHIPYDLVVGPTDPGGAQLIRVNGSGAFTGTLTLPASTTAAPSLIIPHGAPPTTPSNGHIWTTTAGLFARINGATVQFTTGVSVDVTLSAIGSSPNVNGASLAGQVLNLEPASASFGGVVTTGAQTFAGVKTFAGIIISPASTTSAASIRLPSGTAPTTPVDGDIWNQSSTKSLVAFTAGARTSISGTLYTANGSTAVGPNLTGAEISIVQTANSTGSLTLPANFFTVGKYLRLTIHGSLYDSGGSTQFYIKIKFGTTLVANLTAVTTGMSNLNDFCLTSDIACIATGVSGELQSLTRFIYGLTNADTAARSWSPNRTQATFNTTNSVTIDVTAQWAGNNCVTRGFSITLEALN